VLKSNTLLNSERAENAGKGRIGLYPLSGMAFPASRLTPESGKA